MTPSERSFSWSSGQVAVAAWIAAALAGVPVLWGLQSMARLKSYPSVVLHWNDNKGDGLGEEWVEAAPSDPAPAAGEELVLATVERSILGLHIYVLADHASSGGDGDPVALLTRARAYLRHPEIVGLLVAAGLGHEKTSEIDGSPELLHVPAWCPAAAMAVYFNVAVGIESRVGYVAEVKGTLDLGDDQPIAMQYPIVDEEEP